MTYLENDEEKAVNILNNIKERSFLTEKEVQMSNELIRRRKIIEKQDEIIKDNYDTMIKIRELIENDYFEDGSFENYDKVMNLLKGKGKNDL